MTLFYFIDEETHSERLRNFPKFTQLVSSEVDFEPVFGRFQSFCSKHIYHIIFNNYNFSYILKYTKNQT